MLHHLKSRLDRQLQTMGRFLDRPIQLNDGELVLGLSVAERRAQARRAQRERDRPLKRALFELLGRHPGARVTFRHLDLVECALRSGGLAALEKMPVRILAKALQQLEQLVWDWSSEELAELRSRLAVMVKTRPAEPRSDIKSTATFALDLAAQADVTEVDHSMFEASERSWTGGAAPKHAA